MGVFGERDGLAGVAQQPGDNVQRDLVGECERGEGVAETVKSHVSNPGPFTVTPKTPRDGVRARGAAVGEDEDEPCVLPTRAEDGPVVGLVLAKIVEITGTDIPQLDEYLASNEPWRETEALAAIRAYQAERAAKKASSRR